MYSHSLTLYYVDAFEYLKDAIDDLTTLSSEFMIIPDI